MDTTLSSDQVAELAGVTWRQIDYWARRRYLTTEARPATTQGYPRRYSRAEAQVARTMGRLVAAGLSPAAAARAARGEEIGPGVVVVVIEDDD